MNNTFITFARIIQGERALTWQGAYNIAKDLMTLDGEIDPIVEEYLSTLSPEEKQRGLTVLCKSNELYMRSSIGRKRRRKAHDEEMRALISKLFRVDVSSMEIPEPPQHIRSSGVSDPKPSAGCILDMLESHR